MAIVKEEVLTKVDEIGGWATVNNYGGFRAAVTTYFKRSGTEFSRAYYRMLRYSFAEAILEHLQAEYPSELPAIPSERPNGYNDVREVLREDGAESICAAILSITRAQYNAGLKSDGQMPPVFTSSHLESWTTGLTAALTTATAALESFGDYLEDRYDEYYDAIVSERCGRTRLRRSIRIEELTTALYTARHHAELVEEYELKSDEPIEIREMMTNDGD